MKKNLGGIIMYQLKENALVAVVDMIEGFINFGALASPDIQAIVSPMAKFLEGVEARTVFLVDSHDPDSTEFQDFPPHCITGSGEDQVIAELQPFAQRQFRKNSVNAFQAEGFRRYLEEEVPEVLNYYIIGCCTDICVLNLALSLKTHLHERNAKKEVYVIEDLVETFDLPGHDKNVEAQGALRILKTNGVKVISLDSLKK